MNSIRVALRNIRKEAGLTQQYMADALGFKQPTVAGIEGGRVTTTEVVEKWAELCGAVIEIVRPGSDSLRAADPELRAEALEVARLWLRLPAPIRASMAASMRAIVDATGA